MANEKVRREKVDGRLDDKKRKGSGGRGGRGEKQHLRGGPEACRRAKIALDGVVRWARQHASGAETVGSERRAELVGPWKVSRQFAKWSTKGQRKVPGRRGKQREGRKETTRVSECTTRVDLERAWARVAMSVGRSVRLLLRQ